MDKFSKLEYTLEMNFSALPIRWGELLSTILPGAWALTAILPYLPEFTEWLSQGSLAQAMVIIAAATLLGGSISGFTRFTWEYGLFAFSDFKVKPLSLVVTDSEKMKLYEFLLDNSYKWVGCHANTGWATLLVLLSRLQRCPSELGIIELALSVAVVILFTASYVQWWIYVDHMNTAFGSNGGEHVQERTTDGV